MSVDVGFAIHPDDELLDRCEELVPLVDYLEVAPETTWYEARDGELVENAFSARFRDLGARYGKSFVAHGVALSLGDRSDGPRVERWLARLERDRALFDYRWYTDHSGMTCVAGEAVSLPVPVPLTRESAERTRARLDAMRRVAPLVGLETSAHYFTLGDPLDEPAWLGEVLREQPEAGLLLDLHNVWTMAQNLGFDARDYLARLDTSRVIELHVSGGSDSDPSWLPEGRTLRLDGHDDAVPEPVFALLAEVAPRCPELRGITLERMEGTVRSEQDVARLREELVRLRAIAEAHRPTSADAPAPSELPDEDPPNVEARMLRALRAKDPALEHTLGPVQEDGLRIAAMLVAKLRFERLMRGSNEADAWFERDPRGFVEAFRAYHASTPIDAFFPAAEGRRFEAWLADRGAA